MSIFRPRKPLTPRQRMFNRVVLILGLVPMLWLIAMLVGGHWMRHRMEEYEQSGQMARWLEANNSLRIPVEGDDAVLLLHGFADGSSVWQEMAPVFAEEGFAVDAPLMSLFDLDSMRKRIDRRIASLRDGNPDRRVWLVGHSLGAAYAFDAALRPENRIAGVVMLAPFLDPAPRRTLGLTPRQWHRVWERVFPGIVFIDRRLLPGHSEADGPGTAGFRTRPFMVSWDYENLFETADAIRSRAADWHGPLRMALAQDDTSVDNAAAERFFHDATNATPAQFAMHPGPHDLPLSDSAKLLAHQICQFMRDSAHAPASPSPLCNL